MQKTVKKAHREKHRKRKGNREEHTLIRLRDIRKDNIDHTDKHPVFQRMSRVLHNRDNVRPLGSQAHQIPSTPVTELNGVHDARRPNNVADVRHTSAGSGT